MSRSCLLSFGCDRNAEFVARGSFPTLRQLGKATAMDVMVFYGGDLGRSKVELSSLNLLNGRMVPVIPWQVRDPAR